MATESNFITAADHNFTLYAGDSWACELIFTEKGTNAPIDLTGNDFKLQVKRRKSDPDTVKEFTLSEGLSLGGDGNNVVTVNGNTNLIPAGTYYYDLQATKEGIITTYLKGTFKVEEDVTR